MRMAGLLAAAWLLALPLAAAEETELETLKREFEAMRKRIEMLETAPAPGQRGVLELESADTVLSVGGRVQLDALYGWPESSYFAKSIPMDNRGEDGQLAMSARDSRLWVKVRRPAGGDVLRGLIEIDFRGVSGSEATTNSHGPRLRHAYVTYGGLSVGQTNSLFNSLVALDTVNYALNDTLVRQPLVRYGNRAGRWGYDLSLEQPETTLLDSDGAIVTPKDDRLPDIGARLRCYPGWGEAALAGMVRYIAQDRYGDTNRSSHAWGWGLNASARVKTAGRDDIRVDLQYGNGIGRYLAYNAFAAGTMDAAGTIRLLRSYGGHLGYRHWWRRDLRSTVAYAAIGTEAREGFAAEATKRVRGMQANLIWTPLPGTLVVLEYADALRELENGEAGELQLLRVTLRYTF